MTGSLLDAVDLAPLLNCDRTTVWRWTRRGILPSAAVVWFGRVARYRRDVLEQAGWIKPTVAVAREGDGHVG